MKLHSALRPILALLALMALIRPAQAQNYTYTTLDDPAAPPGFTEALGISGGNIVGNYGISINIQPGFLYNIATNTYTTLQAPNSDGNTTALGIDGGNIVGSYHDTNGEHGFLYNLATKTWTTFDDPNTTDDTVAQGISGGNIVGWYQDVNFAIHGFLYNIATQTYTTLDEPNTGDDFLTTPTGISGGNIVGSYLGSDSYYHGFLYNIATQTYTTLDGPNGDGGFRNNQLIGIDGGTILGDDSGTTFLYNLATQTYTTLSLSVDPNDSTTVKGISGGNIVGYFNDYTTGYHGFLATPTPIAPSISLNPANQSVNADDDAGFSAQATGTPAPSLIWQISTDSGGSWSNLTGNVTFAGVNTADLVIMGTPLSLNGNQFRLFAYNTAGNATSGAATLTVNSTTIAPSFSLNPTNQSVNAGDDAGFSAQASGTPAPTLIWQISTNSGGSWGNLTGNVTFAGVNTADLVIMGAPVSLNGNQFRLFAYNTAGSATSGSATLTVNSTASSPAIITQPANVAVLAGGNATFTVVATGSGNLSYQWQFNGKSISKATASTYTITKVAAANVGNYTVVVSNGVGSPVTSAAATLTLGAAPKITTSPAAQSIPLGGNTTLAVVATGTAPLAYQWQLNGANLTDTDSANYTLTNATLADSGNYAVIVSNAFGNATSKSALLTVVAPPVINTPPGNLAAIVGKSATLTVVATGAAPLTYQWYLAINGTPTLINGATKPTYTIAKTAAASAGSYTVVVGNLGGNTTSAAAVLTVNTPPTIAAAASNFTGAVGGNATLTIVPAGTAPFTYQWLFKSKALANGVQADGSTVADATTAQLQLGNLTTAEAGAYTILLTNIAGNITSKPVTLTVLIPPSIVTGPQTQAVNPGATVTFTVKAAGSPTLTYQWQFEGGNLSNVSGKISGNTTTTLKLTKVTAANAGPYRVIVTNPAGSQPSGIATLTVNSTAAAKP
jgi:hypothetical protein